MKKIIAFLALICIISTLALTGCSSFTREIIEFVELPDQYYIEYEVVGDDGTVKTIARGRDANGNYYYRASGVETIYLIDGEYYTAYDMSDGEYIAREDRVKESFPLLMTPIFLPLTETTAPSGPRSVTEALVNSTALWFRGTDLVRKAKPLSKFSI